MGIYLKNSKNIFCQILRSHEDFKNFFLILPFQRSLIENWLDYQLFREAFPPYDNKKMNFAIRIELYNIYNK